MTGELLIGTAGSFAFEGSSPNAFETYLAVVDPTADRTITFPDASGNMCVVGQHRSTLTSMPVPLLHSAS
jgi:hypothetical protein